MNILLIRPNSEADELIPPFGLGYLASAARGGGHDVEILDGLKEDLNLESLEKILKNKKYDAVGIQVFTCHIETVKKYIQVIKKVLPDAYIIVGGPHPSASPKDIFDYFTDIHFAFWGEAEIGLKELLDFLKKFKPLNTKLSDYSLHLQIIRGLIWKNGRETRVNEKGYIEDLDKINFPAWDLMKPNEYPLAPHGAFFKNYPIAPIIITRGCPYSCTYCAGHLISGKKLRKRGIENVIQEIKILTDNYGIKEIHIEDDNFTFYPDLVKEFCEALKKNNIVISWTCPNGVRLDTLSKEILELMKSSGLYALSVGIESGSEKTLKEMKKSLTKEKIKEKLTLIKESGLKSIGFFIIGYPTETKKDILETIDFSRELPLDRATFSIFKPFPGTEITNSIIEKGEIDLKKHDFSKFMLNEAVYSPKGISIKELKNLRRKALLSFYLRPKILFRMARDIKNLTHFKIVMRRIFRWIFK